ncbi:transposable element tc3 transposase [Lasius niger]|uniref:Transposable element tc3 transposase n=1 Tax=Lasius niger TaxID=67767 RepID=A0A0J7K8W1_LASNI|nr:transposable element tc3 transposase [Lasius niger]
MIRLYFTNGEQAAPAAIEYANLYPNRHHPNPNVIAGAVRRLRETGSVLPNHRDGGRPRRIRNLVMEDAIVAAVRNDPTLSTRSVARQLDVSHMSVHRVLKENEQYPYHYTKVQHLLPRDYQLRVNFADYYLNQIGPFTLPARLNSQEYLDFLRNDLPDMLVPAEIDLEDVALNRRAAIFMHDGAPAHSARIVRRYLDETFPQGWFGQGSVTPWPARSPDYNPCDFFLWGATKEKVFLHTNIETADEMEELVFRTIERIENNQIRRATQSVQRRAEACIEVGGTHFEHLL